MYVILIGGGNVGIQLAKRLIARGEEVIILEKDASTAGKLANMLGDEYVMHGDGCEIYTQGDAGFNRADVIVAVTGEDEDNFVVSQLAKEVWKIKRVIARVNDPSHEETFRQIGIDETVSATAIIYNLIVQQISSNDLVPVGALHRGNVEIVEIVLSARSPLVGKTMADMDLPDDSFVVYAVRDGQGMPITPETVLHADDMVVALVPLERADALREKLCG
ncbi:MAG TPA: TrkA family potassium uptake protein [Fimbriimonadaceae bacterium]|nr:TrkA family potassium uptake protein [Fimbriimonadaceae bacterium]